MCAADTAQPLISVIIVVRNGLSHIEKALISVLSQERGLYELIVIDGSSTDGTLDILREYSDAIHYWVSEPDRGIYDAMNKGIKQAKGKYLYFLGSDDVLTVNLRSLTTLLTDPFTIYYGNVRTSRSKGTDGPYSVWRIAVGTIMHQAMFYPRAAFENGFYSLDYKICADWEFNLRCFGNKRLRFQHIPHEIAYFAVTGLSSQVKDDAFRRDRLRLVQEHLPIYVYWYASIRSTLKGLLTGLRSSAKRGASGAQPHK